MKVGKKGELLKSKFKEKDYCVSTVNDGMLHRNIIRFSFWFPQCNLNKQKQVKININKNKNKNKTKTKQKQKQKQNKNKNTNNKNKKTLKYIKTQTNTVSSY